MNNDTDTTVEPTPDDVDSAADVADVEQSDDTEPQDDDPASVASMNAESAKWRRKLRETQAELKAAAAQLDAVQRQQVEFLLAKSGVKPSAVFAVAEIADLLNDDGGIDADKLNSAVATATEKFGIVKPAKGSYIPGVGNQPSSLPTTDAWRDAFTPKRG